MNNKVYTILALLFLSLTGLAQAPEKLSYQAIVRDNNNNLVVNQAIRMRLGIYRNSTSGVKVFEEVQTPTTNLNGLASLQIGTGTVVVGLFDTIRWENGPYFLKREIDITGGTNYNISGETELLSVPYALYSKKVENIANAQYKLNYTLPQITSSNTPVTVITTTNNWEGDRRIMLNGYVTFVFDFPAAALTNSVTFGEANVSLYLKYDGQTIMPLDLKHFLIKPNAHITLPITALIPKSTAGNLKQFSVECTDQTSKSLILSTPSNITDGGYAVSPVITVILNWVEL